jgi:hypothetical protein
MRKLLVLAALLVLPGCGDGGGGNPPTPVTQPPAPPVTQPPPPPPPQFANVSGYWDSEARRWHFRLTQSGSVITGQLLGFRDVYYDNPDHADLFIRGTVAANGAVTFGCNAFGVSFTGRVESATRMTGTTHDCGNGCRDYGEILVKTGN